MSLKYIEKYDYTSTIGDRTIKFKQWTAGDEKKYLQLIEKHGEKLTDTMIYDTLIINSVEDKEIVLSTAEQKKLMIDIRIESISDLIVDIHECKHCKEEQSISTEINSIMKYIPSNYKTITIGEYEFNFGSIRTNKEKKILNLDHGLVDYMFKDFLLHIYSIKIDGVLHDKFKLNELSEFIDKLPTKIFDELFESYISMLDLLELNYKFTCKKCKMKEVIDYSHIPNLLWA